LVASSSGYLSIESMVKAVKEGLADWSRVRQNKEHVLHLLGLLLKEMNKDKLSSKHKQLGDINTTHMRTIKIPQIGRSLNGLLNSYAKETQEDTSSAGLSLMKERLSIEDTFKRDPLEGKEEDWSAVHEIFASTRRDFNITKANIISFLEQEDLTREEETLLAREMRDNHNPAAREALVRPLFRHITPVVNRAARQNSDLDIAEVTQEIRLALFRLAWRYDPTKAKLRTYAFSSKRSQGKGRIGRVNGVIIDNLIKKRGTRRKTNRVRERTIQPKEGELDWVVNIASSAKQDNEPQISPEEVRALLNQIYQSSHKQRNIDIYMMHLEGMSAVAISRKLEETGKPLTESRVSQILIQIRSTLEEHLSSLEEGRNRGKSGAASSPVGFDDQQKSSEMGAESTTFTIDIQLPEEINRGSLYDVYFKQVQPIIHFFK